MTTLFYTFRTFPWKESLPNAFVFGKIKAQLPTFFELVDNAKPDWIIGIARSPNS